MGGLQLTLCCTISYIVDTETRLLRAEEVFARFPRVFQHVSDDVKTRMLKYFETKVSASISIFNALFPSS